MTVDAAVMADHQGGGVNKGDPGRWPLTGLEIDAEGNQRRGDDGYQPGITEPLREGTGQVPTDMEQVISFEVAVMGLVKMNEDRHDFAQRQAATPAAFTLSVLELLAVPVG